MHYLSKILATLILLNVVRSIFWVVRTSESLTKGIHLLRLILLWHNSWNCGPHSKLFWWSNIPLDKGRRHHYIRLVKLNSIKWILLLLLLLPLLLHPLLMLLLIILLLILQLLLLKLLKVLCLLLLLLKVLPLSLGSFSVVLEEFDTLFCPNDVYLFEVVLFCFCVLSRCKSRHCRSTA